MEILLEVNAAIKDGAIIVLADLLNENIHKLTSTHT